MPERLGGPNAKRARRLRADQTDAEAVLWSRLRNQQVAGHKFRRQVPRGPYILDFACLERKVIVEVDGSQHMMQTQRDSARTRWLEQRGYRVLRFWNTDVLKNPDGVAQAILQALEARK